MFFPYPVTTLLFNYYLPPSSPSEFCQHHPLSTLASLQLKQTRQIFGISHYHRILPIMHIPAIILSILLSASTTLSLPAPCPLSPADEHNYHQPRCGGDPIANSKRQAKVAGGTCSTGISVCCPVGIESFDPVRCSGVPCVEPKVVYCCSNSTAVNGCFCVDFCGC